MIPQAGTLTARRSPRASKGNHASPLQAQQLQSAIFSQAQRPDGRARPAPIQDILPRPELASHPVREALKETHTEPPFWRRR